MHAVDRHGGDAGSRDGDQPALQQPTERRLHRPLRQPGPFRNVEQRDLHRRAPAAVRFAPQKQIYEKRRRLSIVAHQIAHQRVDDVFVQL